MDWSKNRKIVEKYAIKRSVLDYILPILIITLSCYGLSILIMLIANAWFDIRFFIDTIGKVAGVGVALSLLAFMPRIYRVKVQSRQEKLDEKLLYTKSELKAKLSYIDIIVLVGSLLAIFTSLLLRPLYIEAATIL